MTERPGHIGNRDADRFQGAGRLVDKKTLIFCSIETHQLVNDGIDVPVRQIRGARQNRVEHLLDEVTQISPEQCAESLVHSTPSSLEPSSEASGESALA